MQIEVLDKGSITLEDWMGSDLDVVNAARVSFGDRSAIWTTKDDALLEYLAKNKHDSPFRHVMLKFHLKAPEFVMRQWYKHVVGIAWGERTVDHAWNELSGRYGRYADFYHPEMWRKQSIDNKQCSTDEPVYTSLPAYDDFIKTARTLYKAMMKDGVAREQARMVLPVSFYTEVIWTTSLQAVLNFISLRDHPHAQWEIQQYAKAVKELVATVAPKTMVAWAQYRS